MLEAFCNIAEMGRRYRAYRRWYFIYTQVPYFSSPACRRILLSVPMGTSSNSLPGTVILPALVACLHCRLS